MVVWLSKKAHNIHKGGGQELISPDAMTAIGSGLVWCQAPFMRVLLCLSYKLEWKERDLGVTPAGKSDSHTPAVLLQWHSEPPL